MTSFIQFLSLFLLAELVYGDCNCFSTSDECVKMIQTKTYKDFENNQQLCETETYDGEDIGCALCCNMNDLHLTRKACNLRRDHIYYEAQRGRLCMKHAFNNCVQREVMRCEDRERIVAEHHRSHAIESVISKDRGYDSSDPGSWLRGIMKFIKTRSGVAIHGDIYRIPESDTTAKIYANAHHLANDAVFNDDFVCILFNGKYLETDPDHHFTTLTKVITNKDGAFELWYLDSAKAPAKITIGGASTGIKFNDVRDPKAVPSFKFEDESREKLKENVALFLSYFMKDYFVKLASPKARLMIEVKKTEATGSKKALEEVPRSRDVSAMEVHPVTDESAKREYEDIFNAQQQYMDLFEDYQYDVAVEEAREKRAIQRLSGEKEKVLRSKEVVDKLQRKTYYRY